MWKPLHRLLKRYRKPVIDSRLVALAIVNMHTYSGRQGKTLPKPFERLAGVRGAWYCKLNKN